MLQQKKYCNKKILLKHFKPCFDLSKDKTLDKKETDQVKITTHTNVKEISTITIWWWESNPINYKHAGKKQKEDFQRNMKFGPN